MARKSTNKLPLPPLCRLLMIQALAMILCSSLHATPALESDYGDDSYTASTAGQDAADYAEFSQRSVMPGDGDDGYSNVTLDLGAESEVDELADAGKGEPTGAGNAGWGSFKVRDQSTVRGESSLGFIVAAGTAFASTDSVGSVMNPLSTVADEDEDAVVDPDSDAGDDEVYFDTSGANITIYKAGSGGEDHSDDGGEVVMSGLTEVAGGMRGCGMGNPIDDCWRCDAGWRRRRQDLAGCALGFGRGARGGRDGPVYVVTDPSDDALNPSPGTLRHALTRSGPLWIVFNASMTIRPVTELWVTSYKTIDGRGAEVHIVGVQTTIQNASHVIVHGVAFHDIKVTGPTMMQLSPHTIGPRPVSDGDALHILNSKYVWIDHCFLARAVDGLLDATRGSNFITISNNVFESHNKVILLGSSPTFPQDRRMRATLCYNRFGPGLIQRLPRCRYGVFHVLNNHYANGWKKYAIGGSEDPTILSQGNVFDAGATKEVTKHIDDQGPTFGGWQKWNWASSGDVFRNGAYFTGSGSAASQANVYVKAVSAAPRPASLVPAMTKSAGPILSGL